MDPASSEANQEISVVPSTLGQSSTLPLQLEQLKILLVEDNLINQKVTLTQLKHLGYTADVAANGQEALQILAHTAYDIILMDCQMPVLDGYETTQAIRQLAGEIRQIPIIALTANAMKEDEERCLAAGMDDYLSKPILKMALGDKLLQWIQVLESRRRATRLHSESIALVNAPPAPQTVKLLIDWEHLHRLCDDNQEFEMELLQIFLEDTQRHLQRIATAIGQQNAHQLEQEAHHIRGSSANLGLIAMQAVASQLEQQAYQNQLQGAAELLADLHQSLDGVRLFLAEQAAVCFEQAQD